VRKLVRSIKSGWKILILQAKLATLQRSRFGIANIDTWQANVNHANLSIGGSVVRVNRRFLAATG